MKATETLREFQNRSHHGVEFDPPLNPDEPPLEEGGQWDATIMMEHYPIFPTLFVNAVTMDGEFTFPEGGEILNHLAEATLVHEPDGGDWWFLQFESDWEEDGFYVTELPRQQGDDYLTIQEIEGQIGDE